MIDIDQILKENKARNKELDKEYNPYTGLNSPIERFKFHMTPKEAIMLPVAMKDEQLIQDSMKAGSLLDLLNNNIKTETGKIKTLPDELYSEISELRIDHDYEFWAATNIKIKHKITGENVWFVLNRGQRKLLKSLERQRLARIPIRNVVVKARQWGGSTEIEFYSTWMQRVIKKNWNSCIVADVEDQATTIRGMYTNAATQYPESFGTMTMKPFEGSTKTKIIEESGSIVSIGSMQKPESLRSKDLKIAHFSEVGSFRKTLTKTPEELMQSIKSAIPRIPDTLIVEESTAKGVGNYFHKAYKRAKDGESGYDMVFVAWHEIEWNRIPLGSKRKMVSFINSFEEYDWWLWNQGATIEGINWYKIFKRTELGDDEWVMKSENPTTAEEAFQSTGHRVFAPSVVLNARKNCTKPIAKGVLYADGQKGKESLRNISFEKGKGGHLWIWAFPDRSITVKNRYVVPVDIGGKSKGADWSVIRVIDKYWMIDGGVPEVIATLRIHVDQDLLAWLAVQVAEWYNHGEVVVENNSLTKYANTEGNGFLTILNEVSEIYDNLYQGSKQDVSEQGIPIKYGFHTNTTTKPLVINNHRAAMRDDGYIERDERALDEADTFENKPDGTMGAVDGAFDDIEMSTAIGIWVAQHDSEPAKVIDMVEIQKRRDRAKKKVRSAASF